MSALPARQRTLPALLELQAEQHGDRPFLTVGETRRTFAEQREAIARLAGGLAAAGIGSGDRVAVLSENRLEVLDTWFACGWLGAIHVPINPAARGPQLEHMLTLVGPRTLACEPALFERLDALERLPGSLERIWALDPTDADAVRGIPVEPLPAPGEPRAPEPVGPGDTASILFTSGTTGPSKGVVCPHAQFYWWGPSTAAMLGGIEADDVLYTCLPLYHTYALNTCIQALVHGARYTLGPRFSVSQFWSRLVEAEATITYLMGAMVPLLLDAPPVPAEREHRVRVALAPGTPAGLPERFLERFGVALRDGFGMTETNAVIGAGDGRQPPGTMGYPLPGYEVRVVDELDEEVPDGTPGELVLRAREPFAFATGYWRMPEQTVAAWRNLWFHTGDRVVREPDGALRFVDRVKDSIRRRGENISAWEVEQVLQSFPAVASAAAVPVPSGLGDDEVLAVVVPRAGMTIDPEQLIRHCETRLAYFAVPRYVDVVNELPMTPSGKIKRYELRERGLTPTTWDREAAGVVVRR
jgi:crotonobetaine/carnitine-CoA ligase